MTPTRSNSVSEEDGAATVALPTGRPAPCTLPEELVDIARRAPVAHLALPEGSAAWFVFTHELARLVLTDTRFSVEVEPTLRPAPPGVFLRMEPPEHTRYRRLLAGMFSSGSMDRRQPLVERRVEQRLAAMALAGPRADLVPVFAVPLVTDVLGDVIGVPESDGEFTRAVTAAVTPGTGYGDWNAARDRLHVLLGGSADGVLGTLDRTGELTEDEILGAVLMMVSAGHETTSGMLTAGVVALHANPEQLAHLHIAPDRAVNELLRFVTVTQRGAARLAVTDVELAGRLIREGDLVLASLPLANRDERRYANPDELDLTRNAAGHMAFGHGVHQCIGQHLARVTLRTALPALFRRFPGLRPAMPLADIPMRDEAYVYGAAQLPVTW